jgi:hypothetical protein
MVSQNGKSFGLGFAQNLIFRTFFIHHVYKSQGAHCNNVDVGTYINIK